VNVEVLYFEGCPNWRTTEERLTALQPELGFDLSHQLVSTPEDAERLGFRGSPTILVDGIDPFASGLEPIAFACRIYETPAGPAGSPTVEQLHKALSRPQPPETFSTRPSA
jgi:hypothetical protein